MEKALSCSPRVLLCMIAVTMDCAVRYFYSVLYIIHHKIEEFSKLFVCFSTLVVIVLPSNISNRNIQKSCKKLRTMEQEKLKKDLFSGW